MSALCTCALHCAERCEPAHCCTCWCHGRVERPKGSMVATLVPSPVPAGADLVEPPPGFDRLIAAVMNAPEPPDASPPSPKVIADLADLATDALRALSQGVRKEQSALDILRRSHDTTTHGREHLQAAEGVALLRTYAAGAIERLLTALRSACAGGPTPLEEQRIIAAGQLRELRSTVRLEPLPLSEAADAWAAFALSIDPDAGAKPVAKSTRVYRARHATLADAIMCVLHRVPDAWEITNLRFHTRRIAGASRATDEDFDRALAALEERGDITVAFERPEPLEVREPLSGGGA